MKATSTYLKGFHDICTVLLLVLGSEEAALAAARVLSLFYLRDAMQMKLDIVLQQLDYSNFIISQEDSRLHYLLVSLGISSHWSIAWVLTWCSHVCEDMHTVSRLFDYFICGTPMSCFYFSVAVALDKSLAIREMEMDYAEIYSYLQRFPERYTLHDLQKWIDVALYLEEIYSLTLLQRQTRIKMPSWSCAVRFNKDWSNKRQDFVSNIDYIDYIEQVLQDSLVDREKYEMPRKQVAKFTRLDVLQYSLTAAIVSIASAWIFYQQQHQL